MGIFDVFRKPEVREERQEPVVPEMTDALLTALLNEDVITREKAVTLPAVCGAVDMISNAIASMPIKLYKQKDGKVEALDKDPRVKLLNGDTGDTLDAYQMKKAVVEDYLLSKGGYIYIGRYRNECTGLFYVDERYISVLRNFKPIHKSYSILVEGQEYKPWEFIKILRNTHDGATGVGLTAEVARALETAYDTMLYQLNLVKSGGSRKGFLKAQRKLAQEEINTLKSAWKRMYQTNAESVVVLNNGLEFQEASASPTEMQLDQIKKTLAEEINSIFHIYPNDFDRTFKEAIYPVVKALETALNRDLLLEKEKKNHYFECDVKEIIRASLKERYEAYKLAKETGFMSLNEIRRSENMEWIEGLDVINVGLGAVLYDLNTHTYYTPNTDTVGSPSDAPAAPENPDEEQIEEVLTDKVLDQEFEDSGNSSDA